MKKRFPVTTRGDAEIVADGGAPEWQVAEWWDSLSRASRLRVATACGADYDELGAWVTLNAMGQQMRIHMYYDARP